MDEEKVRYEWLRPYQWQKGQSGNPEGRKPGKSIKEYARDKLASMTDEEKEEFLHGISKEFIWRMSEGNPTNGVEHSIVRPISIILDEIEATSGLGQNII